MKKRSTQLIALSLLYLVFLIYRLAFWDDFKYLELLQILLNAFFDFCVTCFLTFLFYQLHYLKRIGLSRILYYVFSVVVFVVAYIVCIYLLQSLHLLGYKSTTGMSVEFRKVFELTSYQVFDSYIVLAFGFVLLLAFSFYEKFTQEKIDKEHAEKEHTVSELRFLKAQINPHFIFNTLNNIHFMVDEKNADARQVIQEFCELLRFQLYETGNEKVNIRQEIQYLHNYINIQKIRKEEGFKVVFNIDDEISGSIAPMLFVILVENAFKYAGSTENDYILIDLGINSGNVLTFRIVNTIDRRILPSDSRGGGLGLSNLIKRLNLIYGRDASLSTEKDDELFCAELKIKLFKNESN